MFRMSCPMNKIGLVAGTVSSLCLGITIGFVIKYY